MHSSKGSLLSRCTTALRIIFRPNSLPESFDKYFENSQEVTYLIQSRRDIVQAYEVERARIERDLHDGAQQYLVAASLSLGEAQLLAQNLQVAGMDSVEAEKLIQICKLLKQSHSAIDQSLSALRRTVRGINPQVLHEFGLVSALEDVILRLPAKIKLRCPHPLPELPQGVLASAYFFTCEAVTNAMKYAPDSEISVLLTTDEELHITVVDTGFGQATITSGGGLAGMRARLEAFGGSLSLISPPGGPTTVSAHLPLLLFEGEPGVVVPEKIVRTGSA